MRRLLLIILPLVAVLLATESPAPIIGTNPGNPGDPLILLFNRARVDAANWAAQANLYPQFIASDHAVEADFARLGDAATRKVWADRLRSYLTTSDTLRTLAGDVMAAQHIYDTDALPYCAWTNDPSPDVPNLDAIRLSLPTCNASLQTLGASFATLTLLHESTHHLLRDPALRVQLSLGASGTVSHRNEAEEAFCDAVAAAISRAQAQIADLGVPHWKDIALAENGLSERGFHSALWTGSRMLIWGGCDASRSGIYGCAKYFNDGSLYDPKMDTWKRLKQDGAPTPRIAHGAAWTGRQMIVWGGCTTGDGCTDDLGDGGIYDVAHDEWHAIPANTLNEPTKRSNHSLVWTGREAIVWGGSVDVRNPTGAPARALADGGSFDPATQAWSAVKAPSEHTLTPRSYHTAIWTGDTGNAATANKMLVWGGCDTDEYRFCNTYYGDGAFYDPATGTWTKLAASGVAPSPRRFHAAVYIPSRAQLIIWGGERGARHLPDGAVLDLRDMRWQRMQLGPEGRALHSAVWSGDEIIIFGGETQDEGSTVRRYVTDIAGYTPPQSANDAGRWRTFPVDYVPLRVKNHSAIWSGTSMIVWGGQSGMTAFENIGSAFFPGF